MKENLLAKSRFRIDRFWSCESVVCRQAWLNGTGSQARSQVLQRNATSLPPSKTNNFVNPSYYVLFDDDSFDQVVRSIDHSPDTWKAFLQSELSSMSERGKERKQVRVAPSKQNRSCSCSTHMFSQIGTFRESSFATRMSTLERAITSMSSLVDRQRSSDSESFSATFEIADVRLFIGMSSFVLG